MAKVERLEPCHNDVKIAFHATFAISLAIILRKLNWIEIKKLILRFITLFIFFSAVTYIFNYIFRPSEIDVYDFGTPLGLSFLDIMFSIEIKE